MPSPFLGPMMLLIDERSRPPVRLDAEPDPDPAPVRARQRRALTVPIPRAKPKPRVGSARG